MQPLSLRPGRFGTFTGRARLFNISSPIGSRRTGEKARREAGCPGPGAVSGLGQADSPGRRPL